jgi:hypothetical protein
LSNRSIQCRFISDEQLLGGIAQTDCIGGCRLVLAFGWSEGTPIVIALGGGSSFGTLIAGTRTASSAIRCCGFSSSPWRGILLTSLSSSWIYRKSQNYI